MYICIYSVSGRNVENLVVAEGSKNKRRDIREGVEVEQKKGRMNE